MTYTNLNPQKAFIWRILHRSNLPWVFEHGVHCGSSAVRSPQWVSIGNQELIDKRAAHAVPIAPGGMLNDYVPFYFTPFSVMLRNIHTGWNGIKRVPNADLVILVSSIHRVKQLGLTFLFTDSHAYSGLARYFDDPARLDQIDWPLLQRRDFKRDPEDPGKLERYQAEALVHQHVPLAALLGIVCYTDVVCADIERKMQALNVALPVHTRPNWYF
ncbi:MAG: DUF4433 domain-containing protein [Burkholderiales bacterium]|nr:DUF4433 domain-containing protein [Burkholderiales bacterium]